LRTAKKTEQNQKQWLDNTPGEVDGRQRRSVGPAVLESRRSLVAHWERAEERIRQQTRNLLP